jgi:hypothetical protein
MTDTPRPADSLTWPIAVLAGAGVSMPPPSSISSAWLIMSDVIRDSRLPLTEAQREMLLAATSSDWDEGVGVYHFLRFEQIVEAVGLTVDPHQVALCKYFPEASPNEYHYALAELLRAGALIMTTNFDHLIESACSELGIDVTPIVTEGDYRKYRKAPESIRYPLFKLHGSIDTQSPVPTQQQVAVQFSILGAGLRAFADKWLTITSLLQEHDLLVVGYSGCDDFDIMPAIYGAGPDASLYWSHFGRRSEPENLKKADSPSSFTVTDNSHLDWVFNYHLTGSLEYSRRAADRVMLVQEDTLDMFRSLLDERNLPWHLPSNSRIAPPSASIGDWQLPERAPMLAARLLQIVGSYPEASSLLHGLLGDPSIDAVHLARCHLWIAEMAADGHYVKAADKHVAQAQKILEDCAHDQIMPADVLELGEFPFTQPLFSWDLPFKNGLGFLRDSPDGIESLSSVPMWCQGWRHVSSLRRCVTREDFHEADLVFQAFNEDRFLALYPDELRADTIYWQAMNCFEQATSGKAGDDEMVLLNRAGAMADRAMRVYEKLQRRRKWIDAAALTGKVEVLEGRLDWAETTAHEVMAVSTLTDSCFGRAMAYDILEHTTSGAKREEFGRLADEWLQQDASRDTECC